MLCFVNFLRDSLVVSFKVHVQNVAYITRFWKVSDKVYKGSVSDNLVKKKGYYLSYLVVYRPL